MGLFTAWQRNKKEKALKAVSRETSQTKPTDAAKNAPLDHGRMAEFEKLTDQQAIADIIMENIAKIASPSDYRRLSNEKKIEYKIYQDAICRITDQHILSEMLKSVDGDTFDIVLSQIDDQRLIADTIIERNPRISNKPVLSKITEPSLIQYIIEKSEIQKSIYYCNYFGGHVYENGNVCKCTRCGYIKHSETEREQLNKSSEWFGESDRYEVIYYDYKCKLCGETYSMTYHTYLEKWFEGKG